jgi:hypothetical protein
MERRLEKELRGDIASVSAAAELDFKQKDFKEAMTNVSTSGSPETNFILKMPWRPWTIDSLRGRQNSGLSSYPQWTKHREDPIPPRKHLNLNNTAGNYTTASSSTKMAVEHSALLEKRRRTISSDVMHLFWSNTHIPTRRYCSG